MAKLEYTDFSQAMRNAGIITPEQHKDLNYFLRARSNTIDAGNETQARKEALDEALLELEAGDK